MYFLTFFFFLHPGTNILRQREPLLRCPKMCWVQILLKSLTFLRSAAKLPEALVQLQLCTQPLKQQKSTAPGEVLTFPEAGILLFAQKRVKKKKKKIRYPCKARTSTGHVAGERDGSRRAWCELGGKAAPCPAHLQRGAWRRCAPSRLACSHRQPCELPGVSAEAREMHLTAWMEALAGTSKCWEDRVFLEPGGT